VFRVYNLEDDIKMNLTEITKKKTKLIILITFKETFSRFCKKKKLSLLLIKYYAINTYGEWRYSSMYPVGLPDVGKCPPPSPDRFCLAE
jgi:hypothetical protein